MCSDVDIVWGTSFPSNYNGNHWTWSVILHTRRFSVIAPYTSPNIICRAVIAFGGSCGSGQEWTCRNPGLISFSRVFLLIGKFSLQRVLTELSFPCRTYYMNLTLRRTLFTVYSHFHLVRISLTVLMYSWIDIYHGRLLLSVLVVLGFSQSVMSVNCLWYGLHNYSAPSRLWRRLQTHTSPSRHAFIFHLFRRK